VQFTIIVFFANLLEFNNTKPLKKEIMKENLIDVINSLIKKSYDFYIGGEVEPSKIARVAESMNVELAKDFVEFTQKFGMIQIFEFDLDIFGIDDDPNYCIFDRTKDLRDAYPDFPMDCYVIESFGLWNFVMVQKSNGKIYMYAPGKELSLVADSLTEYIKKRSLHLIPENWEE
jgi:hypothetical protein